MITNLQIQDKKSLKYEDLQNVACRLTKKSEIRRLGLHLGVEDHTIDAIFHNKQDDIPEAVYDMLKGWRKRQSTPVEAYTNLWCALTHPQVQLNSVAHEALFFPPNGFNTRGMCVIEKGNMCCKIRNGTIIETTV